ncbi:hypothetical protein MMF96_18615, partial [Arthrobacter sp. STN4]|nr:hypothetical protein [Arthrobacter sp. STN4]
MMALLLSTSGANSTVPNGKDDPATADWNRGGIDTRAWVPLPGNEKSWGQPPSPGPQDPYIYDFRLACLAGDDGIYPECAASLPDCSKAKGGAAIWWYHSLRNANPPRWRFDSGPACIYTEKPRDILAEIAAQISHEFQKTPVQPATVGSQPGPHTLR